MEDADLKRRNYLTIKVLGMLSLVKWYSILLVIVAQYFAAFFVFNPNAPRSLLIFDSKLHGIIIATAILIAAGSIINSFYDFEKDIINKPKNTMLNTVISSNTALNTYIALNFLGLLIAFLSSTKIFLFFFLFSFALWIYSHKLQKMVFIREISAALLPVSSFFSIALHFNRMDYHVFVYGSMLFAIILIREILKDFIAKEGDIIYGYKTVLVAFGDMVAKRVIYGIISVATLIPISYAYLAPKGVSFYILVGLSLCLYLSAFFIQKKDSKQSFESLNTFYKVLIVLGILGIPFIS